MRDLKLRAYDKDIESFIPIMDWIEDLKNAKFRNLGNEIVTKEHNIANLQMLLNSEHIEITQSTGRKDKNGKEIYEGDIIRFLDESESYTDCGYEYEEYIEVGEVIYNKQLQGWDVTNRYCEREDVWHYMEYIEVIGNIYENKDLLK